MNRPDASGWADMRSWAIWTAGFISFPIAGLAATAAVGRVDGPVAALLGGTVAGLVVGVGQVLASHRRLDPRWWIPATSLGMGGGLLLGAANAEYGTTLSSLFLLGLVTGMVLGVAQTVALPRRTRRRWAWAACMPGLWGLGWVVTTLSNVDVAQQYALFGASGAITFSALSGFLLQRLLPVQAAAEPHSPTPSVPAVA